MGRVRYLTIRIYREMLCITRDLGGTEIISINGLGDDYCCPFYPTTRFRIVLSCELLNRMTMMDRIPFSFTNFITTPQLSGPFYISPEIYHTQITEYSLLTLSEWALFSLLSPVIIKDLPNCYYVRSRQFSCDVEKNWSFMDHLSHTLPTEKIFDLLRQSIRSGSLTRHCPAELVFDMLRVIIKWLEVSFRTCNRKLETNNPICSRDLVPSDRATCTIASRVNSVSSGNSVNLDRHWRGFHNHQILYIWNISAIFKASAYPETPLVRLNASTRNPPYIKRLKHARDQR